MSNELNQAQIEAIAQADAYINNVALPSYSELLQREQNRIAAEERNAKQLRNAEEQARAQVASIVEMVASLECDYDRLEELRDERESLQRDISNADTPEEVNAANAAMIEWQKDNSVELEELEESAGDCENQDDARQRITDDALDVQVRSGWSSPGNLEPEEFSILLCTGGPAVRIVGELDQYNQPCRAWIEYQDWFTPWTELIGDIPHSSILTYCQQFYFGE